MYVIIHGGLKVGTGPEAVHKGMLDRVELDAKHAKAMDPDGKKLMPVDEWEVAKQESVARAALEAKRKELGETKPVPETLAAALALETKRIQEAAKTAETAKPAAPAKK
jgi:hypothetical protein